MTKQICTRFAIRMISPTGEISWHCQGLPKTNDFGFAILYPSMQHVAAVLKQWKMRTRVERLKELGWEVEAIPVQCSFFVPAVESTHAFIEP